MLQWLYLKEGLFFCARFWARPDLREAKFIPKY